MGRDHGESSSFISRARGTGRGSGTGERHLYSTWDGEREGQWDGGTAPFIKLLLRDGIMERALEHVGQGETGDGGTAPITQLHFFRTHASVLKQTE